VIAAVGEVAGDVLSGRVRIWNIADEHAPHDHQYDKDDAAAPDLAEP
jgi:hypothetical protein